MSADLTPDIDDVLQEEAVPVAMTPIPVTVQGPTRVVELPGINLIMDQRDVDNVVNNQQRIFGKDPKRKSLTLIASGGAIRVATTSAMCVPGAGAIIPVGVPLRITADTEVWVAASSGSATTVSYIAEQWAD
jgi:hypothetical protein